MEKLTINHWAEEDRPREKMERLGAQALSNAELLAILIGSGSPRETTSTRWASSPSASSSSTTA